MNEKLDALIVHVKQASTDPDFVHHKWFVQWHLEIVARIAEELMGHYPAADKDIVRAMVWLHDYGKIIDFNRQYEMTRIAGKPKLLEMGFGEDFAEKVISNIETLDKKMELDINQTPIEIQIVSSADGCSHLVGPFLSLWWYENSNKSYEELMADNRFKIDKDWNRKIVLPEARTAFERRHAHAYEQIGELPETFLEIT